jgi:hypothetical protein
MRSILFAGLCAGALASAAPAATYYVSVSGFSDGAPVGGRKYLLAPEPQLLAQGRGLEMDEFGRHVERALSAKGMVRVFSGTDADLLITLGYGMGTQTHDEVSRSAIMGQTGTVQRPGVDPATAKPITVTQPVQGVVGYSSATVSVTEHDRWMRLVAVDASTLRAQHVVREHWRLETHSVGSDEDMRAVFPVMAFAAADYVGADTGKAVLVKVKDKRQDYLDFRARSVSTPPPPAAAPPQ